MSIKERRKRTGLVVALWWLGTVAMIAAGIWLAVEESPFAVFWFVIGAFSVLGVLLAPANWRESGKLMEGLGVGEAAEWLFAQERPGAKRYGKLVITDNWVYDTAFFAPALLPLKEVVWLEKGYDNGGRYTSTRFWVRLHFKNGMTHELKCEFEEQDKLMELLNRRCHEAKFRK